MIRWRRMFGAAMLLALLALTACGAPAETPPPEEETPPAAGEEAPPAQEEETAILGLWDQSILTTDLEGNPVDLADFSAYELVMLNVWGTWCPPCVSELPELEEVSREYEDRGVLIVGLMQDSVRPDGSLDQALVDTAIEYLKGQGIEYLMLVPDEKLQAQFIDSLQYFPTTFFLNSAGEIVLTEVGAKDKTGWSYVIDGLLED